MTIEELVKQLLLDERADVIREAVKAVCAEMMAVVQQAYVGGVSTRFDIAGDEAGFSLAAHEGLKQRLATVAARRSDGQRSAR
jgi:hypothetical protein